MPARINSKNDDDDSPVKRMVTFECILAAVQLCASMFRIDCCEVSRVPEVCFSSMCLATALGKMLRRRSSRSFFCCNVSTLTWRLVTYLSLWPAAEEAEAMTIIIPMKMIVVAGKDLFHCTMRTQRSSY